MKNVVKAWAIKSEYGAYYTDSDWRKKMQR